jgi:hypothetical protein
MSIYGSKIDTFREYVDGIDTSAGIERFSPVESTGQRVEALVGVFMDTRRGEFAGDDPEALRLCPQPEGFEERCIRLDLLYRVDDRVGIHVDRAGSR